MAHRSPIILSTAEAACYSTPEESGLRVETLAFEQIPQQSRLFLDYLKDPLALKRFYPSAVRFHHELAQRVPEVLAAYRVDRNQVCDALGAMNRRWGATQATLDNIELLRESDCIAVVSGQQAGLFAGGRVADRTGAAIGENNCQRAVAGIADHGDADTLDGPGGKPGPQGYAGIGGIFCYGLRHRAA